MKPFKMLKKWKQFIIKYLYKLLQYFETYSFN